MAPRTRVLPTCSNPNRLFAAERGRAGFVGNTGTVRGGSTVLKPLKPLRRGERDEHSAPPCQQEMRGREKRSVPVCTLCELKDEGNGKLAGIPQVTNESTEAQAAPRSQIPRMPR